MAKLRHVAINCEDPEEVATFYKQVFDLEEVGRRGDLSQAGAIFLTDGVVNIALVKIADPNFPNARPFGLNHVGFLVEDMKAAQQKAIDHGATMLIETADLKTFAAKHGVEVNLEAPREIKMRTPQGVAFDISTEGWPGALW